MRQDRKCVTEDGLRFVTGKDCCAGTAYKEFMATKSAYGKTDGRYFYHYTQSFSPDERSNAGINCGRCPYSRSATGLPTMFTSVNAAWASVRMITAGMSMGCGWGINQKRPFLLVSNQQPTAT